MRSRDLTASSPEQSLLQGLCSDNHRLSAELIELAESVANHRITRLVTDLELVRTFMEFHVWCVWDFMMLAKSVQIGVGCYDTLWTPPPNVLAVIAINKIIADEEADIDAPGGEARSHFEIYLEAMRDAGASTTCIRSFTSKIQSTRSVVASMMAVAAPSPCIRFVQATHQVATGHLHGRVAALCLAREELVPKFLRNLYMSLPDDTRLERLRWYIIRHVRVDEATHGPLAAQLFRHVVGQDERLQSEALGVAIAMIAARKQFLDSIAEALKVTERPRGLIGSP